MNREMTEEEEYKGFIFKHLPMLTIARQLAHSHGWENASDEWLRGWCAGRVLESNRFFTEVTGLQPTENCQRWANEALFEIAKQALRMLNGVTGGN